MSTTTSCTAFLQSHVGRLPSRAGTAMGLLPGTKIGAWRVVGNRQPGTRSDTYPIAHARDGIQAAMTVFDAPAVAIASYTRRILETAQILTALEHPGVACILDAGLVADGRPYVVTEPNRGMLLVDRIADELVAPLDALAILRSICEPLIAAHEMGVVHGALALEHVFLVDYDDTQVKLLDWGIERAVNDEARRAGIDVPTRVYPVAPEASLGIVSTKIDVYAVGVIAYRLLLGKMPFEAETQVAMRLAQEETPPDPRAHWPAIPPMLETLLCEMLDTDPRVRPSIRLAAERLAGIAKDLASPNVVFVPAKATPTMMPVMPSATSSAKATAKTTAKTTVKTIARPLVVTPPSSLATEPPPRVEWKKPFNWRIAAVAVATFASAALAIGVVQRADELATMAAAPKRVPVLQPVAATGPTLPAVPGGAVPAASDAKVAPRAEPPAVARAAARVPAMKPATSSIVEPAAPRVAKRPPVVRPKAAPADDRRSTELLAQYQRIGHDLIVLKRANPSPATTEMWQQFRSLKIEPALANAKTRSSAEATLRELREKIERHKSAPAHAAAD